MDIGQQRITGGYWAAADYRWILGSSGNTTESSVLFSDFFKNSAVDCASSFSHH